MIRVNYRLPTSLQDSLSTMGMPGSTNWIDEPIGREWELEVVEELWAKRGGVLVVLHGQPGIGKTTLLNYWLKQAKLPVLRWDVKPEAGRRQVQAFSRTIGPSEHSKTSVASNPALTDWNGIWQYLARLTKSGRKLVMIDEYTDLRPIGHYPRSRGVLTNADWDGLLKASDMCLVLTTSNHKRVIQEFLSYWQAPLYQRAYLLELKPWRYGMTAKIFPTWSPAERVALYTALSGVPALWRAIDPGKSLQENLVGLLREDSLLHRRVSHLLRDISYQRGSLDAILKALASGMSTQAEVAGFTGLPQGTVSKRLGDLVRAEYVEFQWDAGSPEGRSISRYYLEDPFLRFYYTFLLHLGRAPFGCEIQHVQDEVRRTLEHLIEQHTWPALCGEWVLAAGLAGQLPVDPYGLEFMRPISNYSVANFVRINQTCGEFILGRCIWQGVPDQAELLRQLRESIDACVPWQGTWRLHLFGFARHGWGREAQAYFRDLITSGLKGRNWQLKSANLFDLERVDSGLTAWLDVDYQRYRLAE